LRKKGEVEVSRAIARALADVKVSEGLSAKEVAKRADISYDVLRNYKLGRTSPDEASLDRLRKVMKLPKTWPKSEPDSDGEIVSLSGTPMKPIRVVGEVEAGEGAYNVDIDESSILVPERLAGLGGFGWIVRGDSMMPFLQPGMVAVFKEYREPRPGFTFLLKSKDGGLRVKTLEWRDGQWMMISTNPTYAPTPIDDHQLLGYLIGWYRTKGARETMDSDPGGLILSE